MILLGEQIVKFKDGSQKTLEEFVSESSGGGGDEGWQKFAEVKDCVYNTGKVVDFTDLFNGTYDEVMIIGVPHDETAYEYNAYSQSFPGEFLKDYNGAFHLDTFAFQNGQPQTTYPYYFNVSADKKTLTYAGANNFYTNATKIDFYIYVK